MRVPVRLRIRFRPARAIGLAALLLFAAPAARGAADPAAPARRPPPRTWLSTAGERLFREELAAGRLLDHPLARIYGPAGAFPERLWEESALPPLDETPGTLATAPGLAADGRANDRTPLTCAQCQNLPIAQSEPTVASDGLNVLVGWNDYESACGTTQRQNYGWSTDGGATFTDGSGFPPSDVGSRLGGDPTHSVNHKTGAFYVTGLAGGGIGGIKGHFNGSSFVLDVNRRVVTAQPDDFLDKPWHASDSLSGNVYVSWSNFGGELPSRIEFQRFDANLQPTGPIHVLSDTTSASCGAQFSWIAIGPNGEVWISWLMYLCVIPQQVLFVSRSDDFGETFSTPVIAAIYDGNSMTPPAGQLRSFASLQPTLAVDCSNGPHRGRAYLAWDEALTYLETPLDDLTAVVESENNSTYLFANPFVPGGKLRGLKTAGDSDWFKFTLEQGKTFYLVNVYDSTGVDLAARLWTREEPGGPLRLVANARGHGYGLLYSAPATNTYYLELYGVQSVATPYVFWTEIVTPDAGDRAFDMRDQMVSWSDDGTTWSAPKRIVDSPVGFDGTFPSIAVDGRGRVHCFWLDYRDDPVLGAASAAYVASSGDGGVTWGPNRRLADASAYWLTSVCAGSSGNAQGDYMQMVADGDRVVAVFPDTRLGDPDVFVDASVHAARASGPPLTLAPANLDTAVTFRLANAGNYARELAWRLEDTAGWLAGGTPGASGSPTLAPGETLSVRAPIHPDGMAGDSTAVHLIVADPAIPGSEDTTRAVVRLGTPVAAPPPGVLARFLAPPEPNPSAGRVRLRFGLPAPERVELAVFSVTGARVRTLERGTLEAGPHQAVWDGRDARGRPVAAGRYVVRLASGRASLTRPLIVLP